MDAKKKESPKINFIQIFLVLCYLPFIFVGIIMAKDVVSFPVDKLQPPSSSSVAITDSADLLSPDDELKLQQSMTDFYNATGVAIQFTTVEYESLLQQAPLPNNYAEKLYREYFKDDCGWFLLYSVNADKNKSEWIDAKGAQANALIEQVEPYISTKIKANLTSIRDNTVIENLCFELDRATYNFENQEIEFDAEAALPISIMAIFLIIHGSIMFSAASSKKKKNTQGAIPKYVVENELYRQKEEEAAKLQQNNTRESDRYIRNQKLVGVDGECPHCGMRFDNVEDGRCPNCGAPIKNDHICWE